MSLSATARGLTLATTLLLGAFVAGCDEEGFEDEYAEDGWAEEDGWVEEDPDATAFTMPTIYTYEVRINNKATARDVQIRFKCGGDVTTKVVAGSSSNTKKFYCLNGPNSDGVEMKWRANIAGKWEKAQYIYYGRNLGDDDEITKNYETWDWYSDLRRPQKGGNGTTEKLCFYTYELFGVKVRGEECE